MKGFIIVVSLAQITLFFVHYVFYRFGIDNFTLLNKYKFIFGFILAIMSISFSASMFLLRAVENRLTEVFYNISAIWLGTVFWLLLAVVASVLTQNLFLKFVGNPAWVRGFVPIFFVTLSFAISVYGLYNARNTKIVQKDLYIENLPDTWVGRKALFMADTHYGNIHNKKRSIADAKLINSVKPDILLMAGDFFDGPKKDFFQFTEAYKNINPPLGKYFISGNHEIYAGLTKSEDALISSDFTILDNQNIKLDGMQFVGIPYVTNTNSDIDKQVSKSVFTNNGYDKNQPSIVLKHVPIATELIANAGASFVFSGHTHRGQMWPFSLIVKKIYGKHFYGFTNEGATQFYTTSGVGGWGPPQRIGTNSEMLVVTFYKK